MASQEIYDFLQNVYHEGCSSYAIGLLNIMAEVDLLKMNQFQDSLWKQLLKNKTNMFPAVISLRMLVSKVLGHLS